MKSSLAFLFVAAIGGILAGCQSTTMSIESAIVFARSETTERSYHRQSLTAGQQPVALIMPRFAGNVQTAARAGVMAANVGGEASGSAALWVFSPGGDRGNDRVVAAEWLIRGIGPALTGFGVTGALADPLITVLRGSATVAANDDWSVQTGGATAASIVAATQEAGGFALTAGSFDAVLLLTLAPGPYTVQLSGISNTTGVGLIEAYELP